MRTMWLLGLGLLLVLGASLGMADEQPAAGDKSPLEDLKEDDLAEETGPEDPFAYLQSFREWLQGHENPPPSTRSDTLLTRTWRAALKPRAARMRARIDRLLQRRHWLPEYGTPERVRPESWATFNREIAALTTELNGAWKQYQSARDKAKRGIPRERRRPRGSYYGYAEPALLWRRSLLAREALIRQRIGSVGGLVLSGSTSIGGVRVGGTVRIAPRPSPLVLTSYWNLMRRYRAGWAWRIAHCYECERRRREEQQKKAEEYVAERQRLFDSTLHTLEQQLLSTRLLIAAMQAQEEKYLAEDLAALGTDDAVLDANEKTLGQLASRRVEAEQYRGGSSAAYGQLLRQWTRVYTQAQARIRKAEEAKNK